MSTSRIEDSVAVRFSLATPSERMFDSRVLRMNEPMLPRIRETVSIAGGHLTGAQMAAFLRPMPVRTPFPSPDHPAVAAGCAGARHDCVC